MIHRAIMGSIERFSAVLIEHTGGNFPLWLSPVQVQVLPVSQAQLSYAESVVKVLREAGVRAELSAEDSLGKRIRVAKIAKTPCVVVVGDKEVTSNTTTLEHRERGKTEGLRKEELRDMLLCDIEARA